MMHAFYEHRDKSLFIGEMTHFPFPVHVHELAEILSVTSGSVRLQIDETPYLLKSGDVAVIFPLTPHGYDEISPDASGLVAIFPPDIIPEYNSTLHNLVPEYPVLHAGDAVPDLSRVIRRLHSLDMEKDLPLCVAYLHVLLACTLHTFAYRPVYDYSDRGLGQRIMRYIDDHAQDDLSLETVSHAMGISASHLSHFFADKLHVNFRQYINTIRVSHARLLMRDPAYTLTMICDVCGYSNMRTFRRAFLKEVGCLPSEYRETLRRRISDLPPDDGVPASPK